MRFPTVRGSNLERHEYALPDDLEGRLNLVILAFWRRQQIMVDTWMPLVPHLAERDVAVYELPVIQHRSSLSQWFIDGGMRAGIPDRAARERTITLYVDKARFLPALGIRDESTIHALLIDRSGFVLWRAVGSLTRHHRAELMATIEGIRSPAP